MTKKPQHEQDYETVRRRLSTEDSEAWSALSRLNFTAAKVPGLEAQSEADRYAIHGALSWSGHWKVGYDQTPSRHVAALLERLAKADARLDAMRDSRDRAERATEGQRQRADAADARVKELEAQLAGARNAALEEAALLCMEVCQNKVTGAVLARLFREKKSQPPPAPAQAGEDRNHRGENLDEVCGKCGHTRREHADGPCMWVVPVDDDLRACGCGPFVLREQAPTPPALVEAVGPVAEQVRLNEEVHRLPDAGVMPIKLTAAQGRAVLAAYDAAKGGHVETLDKGRVVEVLTRVARSVPDGWGGCARRIARDLGLTLDVGGGK